MLHNESAEYISEEEVVMMRPLLPDFFNASYSWNTNAGCSNTLLFTGKLISSSSHWDRFLLRKGETW